MYYTPFDIYKIFITKKNEEMGKNLKVPNNINRLSDKNKKLLEKIAGYFNTIYHNINLSLYIELGFKKWKTFNLEKVLDPKLMVKYVSFDKKMKRKNDISVINKSLRYIKENGGVKEYCKNSDVIRKPIKDYLHNKIDSITLIYLIEKHLKILSNEEKAMISYIIENYTDIKFKMYKHYKFIKENINNG